MNSVGGKELQQRRTGQEVTARVPQGSGWRAVVGRQRSDLLGQGYLENDVLNEKHRIPLLCSLSTVRTLKKPCISTQSSQVCSLCLHSYL